MVSIHCSSTFHRLSLYVEAVNLIFKVHTVLPFLKGCSIHCHLITNRARMFGFSFLWVSWVFSFINRLDRGREGLQWSCWVCWGSSCALTVRLGQLVSITWSPWLCGMAASGDLCLVSASYPCLSILLPPEIKADCVVTTPGTNKWA